MKFTIPILLFLLIVTAASAFEITMPEEQVYNDTTISFNVEHNDTLESISYALDGENASEACTNCSSFAGDIILAEGEHTLEAIGVVGNDSFLDDVMFTINLTPVIEENETEENETIADFTISLNPTGTVDEADVTVTTEANETLDNLTLAVGNNSLSCNDCDELEFDLANLSEGDYEIMSTGILGNLTKDFTQTFTILFPVDDDDETEENETDDDVEKNETTPRFTEGFNQLPKAVAAGEVSDAELASIISSNNLNPGIINRLIKTGMLGNQSIDALLEVEFQPKGIFGKLFYNIGFKGKAYANQIAKNYAVNETVQAKMTKHPDVTEKTLQKQERAAAKVQKKGDETKVSPGQAKKLADENENVAQKGKPENTGKPEKENNAKVPPGKAKK